MKQLSIWSLVLLCGATLPAAAQSLHFEGGISMATGTYVFTEPTTSWTFSSGLALSAGPLTLRATVPAFLQNTTLVASSTAGLVPTGGSASDLVADSAAARRGRGRGGSPQSSQATGSLASWSVTAAIGSIDVPAASESEYRAAVGDPTFALTLGAVRGIRTSVSLSAALKVPVTDTSTFGTGQWDVGGSLSVSQRVAGTTMVGMDVSFWHLGDLADLPLRDPFGLSLSVAHLTRSGWGFSASAYGARSVIEGFDDLYTVGAGITKLGRRGSVGLSASVGLSETAPDWSLGLQWRTGLLGAR